MNLRSIDGLSQHKKNISGTQLLNILPVLSILLSLPQDAMAQCQNSAAQNSLRQDLTGQPATNSFGASTGFTNTSANGFQQGNLPQFTNNAQQNILQQLFQAQMMNILMQQKQPQATPFNANVQPRPLQQRPQATTNTPQAAQNAEQQIRDPDRPLTREEQRLENLREKEQIKREDYAARIAAREQRLNDLKNRLEN